MEINQLGFSIAYISLLILLGARELTTVSEPPMVSRQNAFSNVLLGFIIIAFMFFMVLFILDSSSVLL